MISNTSYRSTKWYKSSSSFSRAACTDIPDPRSKIVTSSTNIYIYIIIIIIMSRWQHGYPWPSLATPPYRSSLLACLQGYIPYLTELLYVCSSWPSCFCSAICGGLLEYITYELVPASPAVPCMSGSSNLDSFCNGRLVAVQLVLCGVLSPRLVQYCSQHSCVIAV